MVFLDRVVGYRRETRNANQADIDIASGNATSMILLWYTDDEFEVWPSTLGNPD
jgi:hypothetical protein